jgi:Protein of unknown function (DUF3592)
LTPMIEDDLGGAGPGLFGRTRRPVPRWAAYLQSALLIVIGVVSLFSGISRYNAVQPIAGGRTTSGTIVAVSTGQNCGRHGCSTYWVPMIQFTANGRNFTFAGPQSGNSINTGGQVRVSYDPAHPASARDMSAGVGQAWLLIGIGAVVILAGSASFLLGFRRLHAKLNLTSARDGSGWVGHSGLHSARGSFIGLAVVVAIVILQFIVH